MAGMKVFASLYCQAAEGLKQKIKSKPEKTRSPIESFENRPDPFENRMILLKTDLIL
jgi:hypothetical protein